MNVKLKIKKTSWNWRSGGLWFRTFIHTKRWSFLLGIEGIKRSQF